MGDDTAGAPYARRMIRTFMFVLAVAAVVSAVAAIETDSSSASITDDWSYDSDQKVLTYSGPVKMPDYTATENPIVCLDASSALYVKYDVDVTRIGDYTFYGSSLQNVVIPEDVTHIGKAAFSMCTKMKTLTIYEEVVTIGNSAFYNCSSLTAVTMPSSVTSIGTYAFAYCSSLKDLTLPPYDSARYPEGELTIGGRAFYGCSSIESIYIPMNVVTVSEYAFYGCSSVLSLTFQEVAKMDTSTPPKALIYESKITEFGDYAFYGCSSIKEIQLPDMLQTLGKDVFGETSSLETINTRETSTTFRSNDGVLFNMSLSYLYHYPSAKAGDSYTIPSSVQTIEDTAFNGAKKLTSILMGNSDLYCSENGILFSKDMSSLIRYPEGKTNSSYTIPESVTYVLKNAFHGATNLKDLTLTSKTDFKNESLSIGTYDNVVVLHVTSKDNYRINELACNNFTTLDYSVEKKDNTNLIVIIAVIVAVLIIAAIVVLVKLKKSRE